MVSCSAAVLTECIETETKGKARNTPLNDQLSLTVKLQAMGRCVAQVSYFRWEVFVFFFCEREADSEY